MDIQDQDNVPESGVERIDYNSEMRTSFVTYAMSVIVSRALPDVRDGLKPVHRRIVYGMQQGDYHSSKPFKKSARIVGDVMGKYHPHGDGAIYDAFVRLAQPWKVRHPIVDSQGNFGSPDGDPPAAMRYTEARMTRLAHELTADIDKKTVAFRPNYDDKDVEPVVLPARFPHLLVNGQAGIAVGMATNIPTHNLREVIDAALLLMENPSATLDDILAVMPGPDFPTRGVIMGRSGIRQAYETGRGSVMMSGVANVEPMTRGRSRIVISELPYEVNKEELIAKIAEFMKMRSKLGDKKTTLTEGEIDKIKTFEGITDIRDESDREIPVRVVMEIKADADPAIIMNGLRRFTKFQTPFPCNMTCLSSSGKPEVMGVIQMLTEWVAFRRDCVRKRTMFELDKARDSQVKQIGLYAATTDIDAVVDLIRKSGDVDTARARLMDRDFAATDELMGFIREADPDAEIAPTFRLNEVQADAILALTLRSLTGLEREKIAGTLRELAAEIRGLLDILNVPGRLEGVIREELFKIRERFGDDRMTRIETTEADEIENEDLIERRDVVVSLTRSGYVKRTELSAYRSQKRGGKGKTGMETKDDDFVISSIVCTTKTPLLVFTEKGMVYSLKAYRLPDAPANHKGRFIGNFVNIEGDRVTALMPLPEDRGEVEKMNLIFITNMGTVRRNSAKDFLDINRRGKIAMRLDGEGARAGRLVAVLIAGDTDDVLVATANGNAVRFPVEDCRVMQSRESTGVRAITLKDRDEVVDATILVHSDPHSLERDAYLAGGATYIREKDLIKENGERREVPGTVILTPAPEPEKEDRLKVELSAIRMEEMRSEERFLLTVTANGYGKRSSTHDYRLTSRGGSGVRGAVINETTGPLVACLLANDADGLVLVTDGGQTIRTRTSDVSVLGRDTRGVRLLSIPDGQSLVAVAKIPADEDDGEEEMPAVTAA